jgi:pantoate--beta-alanine ligase
MRLQIVDTARELFSLTTALRSRGERIGLVPTMGALHDGHLSLVDAVRAAGATHLVVSIFVNPLQFGPSEDLAKYPRTLADDLARCERHGVDLIYAPTADNMYPQGFQTHVQVEQVTARFEGSARPHHFQGVVTVVNKLFNATGPCIAAFGRKDYQQLRTIARMVRDLDLPITVLGCPIVREPDGLAMSSRNRYLDDKQRVRARAIYQGLRTASLAFARGERDPNTLVSVARAPLETSFDAIDYVSVVDADDLTPADTRATAASILLVAARIGATRLLDNCLLGEECLDARPTET